jgi:hypothetical protein
MVREQIVPLNLHVGIEEPVKTNRHIANSPAVNRFINKINVAKTDANLPSAKATGCRAIGKPKRGPGGHSS